MKGYTSIHGWYGINEFPNLVKSICDNQCAFLKLPAILQQFALWQVQLQGVYNRGTRPSPMVCGDTMSQEPPAFKYWSGWWLSHLPLWTKSWSEFVSWDHYPIYEMESHSKFQSVPVDSSHHQPQWLLSADRTAITVTESSGTRASSGPPEQKCSKSPQLPSRVLAHGSAKKYASEHPKNCWVETCRFTVLVTRSTFSSRRIGSFQQSFGQLLADPKNPSIHWKARNH